jgi:hypothetical protein
VRIGLTVSLSRVGNSGRIKVAGITIAVPWILLNLSFLFVRPMTSRVRNNETLLCVPNSRIRDIKLFFRTGLFKKMPCPRIRVAHLKSPSGCRILEVLKGIPQESLYVRKDVTCGNGSRRCRGSGPDWENAIAIFAIIGQKHFDRLQPSR